jgi:hypothetical protein
VDDRKIPHAFFAGDTRPFVQVWSTKAWSLNLNGRRVNFHGVLSCDASKYAEADLPGWRGSITPDRYSLTNANGWSAGGHTVGPSRG